MPRKLYIETYGCQMNVADTHLITGSLSALGYVTTETPADADVILVNTCAVRENAETRVWGRLEQLAAVKRRRPEVILGVVGCMAQHQRERIIERAPAVDLVLGPDAYRRLGDLLVRDEDEPFVDVRLNRHERYEGMAPTSDNGVTAFVTVQRGCDKFCTFCIVPYVRGRERSLPLDEITASVRALAGDGVREVTLLGQTVNSYHDGTRDFGDLLRAVGAIDGIARVRYTSPHPSHMSESVIAAMAECPAVMPSLHLPLQSADDDVLERMHRGYTYGEYRDLVGRLREAVPDIAVTTDLIVGFSGESEAAFELTLAAIDEIRWDGAFMFHYSPRSGTKAYASDDDVPDDEKHRRLEAVIERQEAVSAERNREWIGRRCEILVEGRAKRGEGWYGRSPQFKNTVFDGVESRPGEFVEVQVLDSTAHTLIGVAG